MKAIKVFIVLSAPCMVFFAFAQQPLSFDTLFPVFWYEKAVQSTMQAIHEVDYLGRDTATNKQQDTILVLAIGHLSFAHFCIMQFNRGVRLLDEDISYLYRLLQHYNNLLNSLVHVQSLRDRIDCLLHMVRTMQKQLQVKANI
jgi:hypothetical protein